MKTLLKVILRYSQLDKILELKFTEESKRNLKILEISVLNDIPDGLELFVPAYRADVTREIDVKKKFLEFMVINKV